MAVGYRFNSARGACAVHKGVPYLPGDQSAMPQLNKKLLHLYHPCTSLYECCQAIKMLFFLPIKGTMTCSVAHLKIKEITYCAGCSIPSPYWYIG